MDAALYDVVSRSAVKGFGIDRRIHLKLYRSLIEGQLLEIGKNLRPNASVTGFRMNVHGSEFLQSWDNRSETNHSGRVLGDHEQFFTLCDGPPNLLIARVVRLTRPIVEHLWWIETPCRLVHGSKMEINDCYRIRDSSWPHMHTKIVIVSHERPIEPHNG